MKKVILFSLFFLPTLFSYSQKSSPPSPKTQSSAVANRSINCPLSVTIQDDAPSIICSELLKTLVAVTPSCIDTNAVTYRWSSSIGGVFSTLRSTTFNLPDFLVATPVTFTIWVKQNTDSLSASYTITVKPRPSRPTLTPVGTVILCDNNSIILSSSVCTGGSTNIWSNGITGQSSISVPAIGGTYFKVACEKNGCVSDSSASVSLITGAPTSAPTTTSRIICEGTSIRTGNGLQAQVNCSTGQVSTHTYTGGTVGYDQGYRSSGSSDPTVIVPSTTNLIRKISISITWRKQKGGFQNDCGAGDFLYWPYHNETQFRIKSPSGRIITLVNAGTYGGENNPTVTTIFEDGASPVNYYSPPVSGTFAPSEPLSSFIGENPSGTWTLLPYDTFWRDPLCVSGFSVTFSDISNGNITWWDAPTGGNQVGTGNEFIPTVTAAGTYTYYAQGECSRSCPSTRVAATLTINPTPTPPVIDINVPLVNSTRNICNGESITLTATGCSNGSTVKWSGNIYGNNFATGNTYTFIPSGNTGVNTTHTFNAACEGTNLCRSANSSTITLTVKYKPISPTISGPGSTTCINSMVMLSTSGCSGGSVGWTGNRIGNTISFAVSNNVTIKAACTINGCTSDSSAYTITTLPRPSTPSVNASQIQAVCLGGSVTLSTNCASGTTTKWTGGLTGSPLTITPTITRNYKASCLGTNGCASDSSTALTITVLSKAKPTIIGNTSVCGPTSTTLTATGCSGINETVMWRDESTGISLTETITQTKTFRAICIRNGYCVSDSSDVFTVQYRNKPSRPTITAPLNTTICQGSSIVLTASTCSNGTLGWTGGLTGTSIMITPTATTSYKVACTTNSCTSDSSSSTTITVSSTPIFTVSANKTSICSGEATTLTATGCNGTLSWTGGATTTSITVSPIATTTYTSTCTLGSCSSSQQMTITALSTPLVTASSTSLPYGQTIVLNASNVAAGSSIQWRLNGVEIVGATGTTYTASTAGSYDFTSYLFQATSQVATNNSVYTTSFLNDNIGLVGSMFGIFKTTNGGTTWTQVYNNTGTITSIQFVTSSIVWAVGSNGFCIKSIDGGNTWTPVAFNAVAFFKKISFKDATNGIIVGDFGLVYTTSDGGASWSFNNQFAGSHYSTILSAAFVPNSSTIGIVGTVYSSPFAALSTNNGVTYEEKSFGSQTTASYLNDIVFTTNQTGFIVGNNATLLKTIDGGTSWQPVVTPVSGTNAYFSNIKFLNAQVGYISGLKPNAQDEGFLLKTTDGGNTWKTIVIPIHSTVYNYDMPLSLSSENTAWVRYGNIIIKYNTPQCTTVPITLTNYCTVFESVKSGAWNDSSTWSCGRVPTSTDDVIIKHRITTLSENMFAKSITYVVNGSLELTNSSLLKVGN